jgi:hypothetical protein
VVEAVVDVPRTFEATLDSLEAARINPEVFFRLPQIPSSGINMGLIKVPAK